MENEEVEQDHPHRDDQIVSTRVYNVAQKIDKILNREDISDHAAILGIIQVTSQRRMHEHEVRKQKLAQQQQRETMERQQDAARRARFAPN
jgi:uncharacterized secreted protein with C-terminal beta-propeller domain